MNIANILTLLRIMSPIFFCCILFLEFELHIEKNIIFIFFIFFSLTDFFDGFLARKLNQVSTFGKIFDPISDKVLTSSTLIYILTFEINILIPAILIIAREFIVSGNREYMLKMKSKEINVIFLSKIKTTFQFLSISIYLAQDLLLQYYNVSIFALVCLWIATILTIYTGIQYSYITFFSNRKRK
jgi:CDP-diacylglycerol--glycerol-3-phosphate 3-phosphatidyltransferase